MILNNKIMSIHGYSQQKTQSPNFTGKLNIIDEQGSFNLSTVVRGNNHFGIAKPISANQFISNLHGKTRQNISKLIKGLTKIAENNFPNDSIINLRIKPIINSQAYFQNGANNVNKGSLEITLEHIPGKNWANAGISEGVLSKETLHYNGENKYFHNKNCEKTLRETAAHFPQKISALIKVFTNPKELKAIVTHLYK